MLLIKFYETVYRTSHTHTRGELTAQTDAGHNHNGAQSAGKEANERALRPQFPVDNFTTFFLGRWLASVFFVALSVVDLRKRLAWQRDLGCEGRFFSFVYTVQQKSDEKKGTEDVGWQRQTG